MPALAAIDLNGQAQGAIPAVKAVSGEARRIEAPKKKQKASALCFTPPAMINDKKKDRSYFRRGLLGEGGFARCFEVTDFKGVRLAAKTVAKTSISSEKVKGKLLGEIRVHKSMDHPHIVKQRDCFEDDVNVYMILDLCPNGTLMDMLRARKSFADPEIRFYGLQLLGAVKYMHSRRVVHRDLKLGNLFLDEDMNLRVGDFGLAALLIDDDDRKKTICGTPNYIAPEVLFGSAHGHSYEVDIWSIGVILYAMTVGKPPFQSKDVKEIYARIKANEYSWPALDTRMIDPRLKDLITRLLSTDPQSRPSIDDIAAHSFFNTGIMPKFVPLSALKQLPEWPSQQSAATFQRNHAAVTERAGVGGGRVAGSAQGQRVELAVERPESGRCLPPSLSPRTGPQARMVSLQVERAGGIAERLEHARVSTASAMAGGARRQQDQPEVTQAASLSSGATRAPSAQQVARSRCVTHGLNEQIEKAHQTGRVTRSVSAAHRDQAARNLERLHVADSLSNKPSNSPSSGATIAPTDALALLATELEFVLSRPRDSAVKASTNPRAPVKTFISRWVDYSHKYGLGYCLTSRATGVHFNDGSSMVLDARGQFFDFVSAQTCVQRFAVEQGMQQSELAKKVHLLKHFRDYMHNNLSIGEPTVEGDADDCLNDRVVYLTRYKKLSGGIMFVLSDGTVQCNFTDHSKLAVATGGCSRFIDVQKRVIDCSLEQLALGIAGQAGRDKLKLLFAHLSE
ncbi:Cell cycle serine/threonine-protein kinase cdc5/MSD2 [Savitreella phatthalungensis]